jgi:hypothetical protein
MDLPSCAAAPNLPNDSAVSEWRASGQKFLFDQRDGLPIGPLDGNQSACI